MSQSALDPCLFIGEIVMCISYVDDLLLWSKTEAHIHDLAFLLYKSSVDLEHEDDAATFVGIRIEGIE